jgi:3-deoxy-D-manno-octulosonic-acid transferase
MVLYSAVLTLALLASSPLWLLRMLTTDRYREGLRERLGVVPVRLRGVVQGRHVLWLHAVSVGEVLAASRLIADLGTQLGDGWSVVISTTTRTGQKLAQQRFGADRVFYYPLDFAWCVRRYLDALQPKLFVLMESELWPRMLHECALRNVPVCVANARISDRTFTRTMRFRGLWQRMARHVSLWLAQSEGDAKRLRQLGVAQSTIVTSGNLKYDVQAPQRSAFLQRIRAVAGARPIIVAGSTVDDDNTDDSEVHSIAHAWAGTVTTHHQALLVVAPRHPQHFKRVEAYLAPICLGRYRRASDWGNNQMEALHTNPDETLRDADAEIILLDTIGDLASVYGMADVAFVGGSLLPHGGHNPLEPAQFGVPVIMGSSYENFRDIVERMKAADAIRIVTGEDELEVALLTLLHDPVAAQAMGERGRAVYESQQGATQRTIAALVALLSPNKDIAR